MGGLFDIIKRLGAIVVVLVLILMMGLIFSSQPIEEITRTIAGDFSLGEFAGDPISRKDYAFYESGCRSWMAEQKFGAAKHFLEYCINTRMRQSYTLAQIGAKLGVKTSVDLMKSKLWEDAQTQYEGQTDIPEEDRLTVHEIYRFNLSSFPLEMRVRQSSAQEAHQVLNLSFPEISQKEKWEKAAKKTTLALRLIYFDDRTITDLLKEKVSIGEAEVIQLFRKEEESRRKNLKKAKAAKLPKPKLVPSPAQRKSIRARLKSTKAKKELDLIKAKIKHLLARPPQKNNKLKLERIAQLTGIEILSFVDKADKVSLEELGRVKAGKNILNLMQKEFLEKIKKANLSTRPFGPIESGPHTVYAEIIKVNFPGLPIPKQPPKDKRVKKKALTKNDSKAKKGQDSTQGKAQDSTQEIPESYDKKTDPSLTKKFLDYVIDEEARRSDFKVQHPES